jgi:D-aminoacyl-tRNA deacylase
MRAVVQRVTRASVSVDGEVVGECGQGFLVLVAAHRDDTEKEAVKMADRVAKLRVFNDEEGKMNLALGDLDPPGSVLAVSNFTLYGETAKNRRPSFIESAPYDRGSELYEVFLAALRSLGIQVETGVFGAHMDVDLVNDGPVTVILDVVAG